MWRAVIGGLVDSYDLATPENWSAMKKIVMNLAVTVDEGPDSARAGTLASRLIRDWTGQSSPSKITLLSARWEAQGDDDIASGSRIGRASGV
jgi:hypothetical protein